MKSIVEIFFDKFISLSKGFYHLSPNKKVSYKNERSNLKLKEFGPLGSN